MNKKICCRSYSETFHFALLLSTCTVLPCSMVIGTQFMDWIVLFTRNRYVLWQLSGKKVEQRKQNDTLLMRVHFCVLLSWCSFNSSQPWFETIVKFLTIGSLAGTWIGALPIPLDWDRPWQVSIRFMFAMIVILLWLWFFFVCKTIFVSAFSAKHFSFFATNDRDL